MELEIEVISDENEELNSKLINKDWDFNTLQRNYEKEKKVSGTKESQKKKGYMSNSKMRNRNSDKFMYEWFYNFLMWNQTKCLEIKRENWMVYKCILKISKKGIIVYWKGRFGKWNE